METSKSKNLNQPTYSMRRLLDKIESTIKIIDELEKKYDGSTQSPMISYEQVDKLNVNDFYSLGEGIDCWVGYKGKDFIQCNCIMKANSLIVTHKHDCVEEVFCINGELQYNTPGVLKPIRINKKMLFKPFVLHDIFAVKKSILKVKFYRPGSR